MYIDRINPHGGDVFDKEAVADFSSNINPCGMPPGVRDALVGAVDKAAGYPDPYCRRLREAISAHEGVPTDCVLCGSGAAELIYAFAYSLPEGRPALIISPAFCEYEAALNAAGIKAEHFILTKENGFTPTEKILSAGLSRFGAVFLCTPGNPSGTAADPAILYEIAKTGVRLFADMCFLDLTDDPERYDIPRLVRQYPNVTVLKAFTKSYAMAGVRLGCALCSDRAFMNLMSEKTQCWNVSTLAQEAGIAALTQDEWLKSSVKMISAERGRMREALKSYGITVYPSEANYLLLYSQLDLYGGLLKRGILVRSCSDYIGLGEGYIRAAVRTKEENDRLLSAVKEVIE